MLEHVMEVLIRIAPAVLGVMGGYYTGFNKGYTKGYTEAVDDTVKRLEEKQTSERYKEFLDLTRREAAGVVKQKPEVAPVQHEKTIWDNPTHQGKK